MKKRILVLTALGLAVMGRLWLRSSNPEPAHSQSFEVGLAVISAHIRENLVPELAILSMAPVSTEFPEEKAVVAVYTVTLRVEEELVVETDAASVLNQRAAAEGGDGGKISSFSGPQAFHLFKVFIKKNETVTAKAELSFKWVNDGWTFRAIHFTPPEIQRAKPRPSETTLFTYEEGSPAAEKEIRRFLDLEKPVTAETPERRFNAMRKARAQIPESILQFKR